jgi:hypothetical protein
VEWSTGPNLADSDDISVIILRQTAANKKETALQEVSIPDESLRTDSSAEPNQDEITGYKQDLESCKEVHSSRKWFIRCLLASSESTRPHLDRWLLSRHAKCRLESFYLQRKGFISEQIKFLYQTNRLVDCFQFKTGICNRSKEVLNQKREPLRQQAVTANAMDNSHNIRCTFHRRDKDDGNSKWPIVYRAMPEIDRPRGRAKTEKFHLFHKPKMKGPKALSELLVQREQLLPEGNHFPERLHHFREHVMKGLILIQRNPKHIFINPRSATLFFQQEAALHVQREAECILKKELSSLPANHLRACDISKHSESLCEDQHDSAVRDQEMKSRAVNSTLTGIPVEAEEMKSWAVTSAASYKIRTDYIHRPEFHKPGNDSQQNMCPSGDILLSVQTLDHLRSKSTSESSAWQQVTNTPAMTIHTDTMEMEVHQINDGDIIDLGRIVDIEKDGHRSLSADAAASLCKDQRDKAVSAKAATISRSPMPNALCTSLDKIELSGAQPSRRPVAISPRYAKGTRTPHGEDHYDMRTPHGKVHRGMRRPIGKNPIRRESGDKVSIRRESGDKVSNNRSGK